MVLVIEGRVQRAVHVLICLARISFMQGLLKVYTVFASFFTELIKLSTRICMGLKLV